MSLILPTRVSSHFIGPLLPFLTIGFLHVAFSSQLLLAQNSDSASNLHSEIPYIVSTSHVLWLQADGTVAGSGEENDGARGDSREVEIRFNFEPITQLQEIQQIATFECYSAALSQTGKVWSWGSFSFQPEPKQQPHLHSALRDVIQIAVGSGFLMALTRDGSVYVSGNETYGILGEAPSSAMDFIKIQSLGQDNVSIAAALNTGFVVKKDGSVWGWGSKFGALLGRTSRWSFLDRDMDPTPKPIRIEGLRDIVQVEGGHYHVLALNKAGEVFAWGNNEDGELGFPKRVGIGETYYQYPAKCQGLPKIAKVQAGYSYSMALDEAGNVWTWGSNTYGCLGIPNEFEEGRLEPKMVSGIQNIKSIHAGDYQAFAVHQDGQIWGWGANTPAGNYFNYEPKTEFIPPTLLKAK